MFNFFSSKNNKETDPQVETYSMPRIQYVSGDHDPGLYVSQNNNLGTDIILAAVTIRSDIMASLPLKAYQGNPYNSKEIDHPILDILREPNEYQTYFDFISYIQMNLDLHGNAYIQQIYNGKGDVVELIPLNSEGVTINLTDNGKLQYIYDGIKLQSSEIIHLKNIGNNIYAGESTISLLDPALKTYNYALSNLKMSHKNGPQLKGVIEDSTPVERNRRQSLEDKINTGYSAENAGKVAVLSNGLTWKSVGISTRDAETLGTLEFSMARICSVFKIPPQWMYSSTVKPSYNSNEANVQAFRTFWLHPNCKKIEAVLNRKLLSNSDKKAGVFLKFNLDSLLRADTQSRFDSHVKAINNGIKTPNECRMQENLPPRPEGDKLFRPMNITYLDSEPK